MSLMGFLTGIGSLFSGASGDKSSSNASKVTNTSQTSANTTTAKGKTTGSNDTVIGTTQSTTGKEATKTTGATSQTGSSTGVTTQAGSQAQETTMYSSDILAGLDALLKSQLSGGTAEQASDATAERLNQVSADAAGPGFDVNNYVNGIAAAAASETQSNLDSRINATLSATGTSETGNSMSALLGNRMRNEAAANLAGITSNAVATGNQIKQQEQANYTQQIEGLSGSLSQQLTNLLGAAQGGTQKTTGTTQQVGTQATQDQAAQTSVGTSDTTSQATQVGTQISHERTKESTAQNQTSIGKVGQSENTQATGSSSTGGGDIFGNLFKKLSDSALAA